MDWLVPAGCGAAADLGAGTGLFTRALLGRVPEVTAVEPDGRMRAVLAERTEGVRDAEVDAIWRAPPALERIRSFMISLK